jgi:hypothetical protein
MADGLTAEQRELWDRVRGNHPPVPSGDQTPGQALSVAVASFRAACEFEGIPVPSDEAVRAEFDRRGHARPLPKVGSGPAPATSAAPNPPRRHF